MTFALKHMRNRALLRNLLILILLNVLLRALWLWYMHPHQALDFEWYYIRAVEMAHGEGYRQSTHYTAYWPIGYPFFLSVLFRVIGPTVIGGLIANAMLSTIIVVLVFLTCLVLLKRSDVAFYAGIGYSLLPSQIEWNSVLGSEELFTAFLLLALLVYILATRSGDALTNENHVLDTTPDRGSAVDIDMPKNRRISFWKANDSRSSSRDTARETNTLRQAHSGAPRLEPKAWILVILSGIALGLACDVRPIPLLFPLVIGLYEWLRQKSWRIALYLTLLMYLGMVLVVAPVTMRNAIAMHHFIIVSTNGGVVLWQGIHTDSAYYWPTNPKQNPLLAGAGNNQYLQGKIGTHLFIQHVLHHPLSTFVHGVFKWVFLYLLDWNVVSVTFQVISKKPLHWLVLSAMWFDTIVYWLWMVVCGIGLFRGLRLLRISWKQIALPLAYIAYNTGIFFFFPAWDRFRYPMMPLYAILFGLGIYALVQRTAQRRATINASSQ